MSMFNLIEAWPRRSSIRLGVQPCSMTSEAAAWRRASMPNLWSPSSSGMQSSTAIGRKTRLQMPAQFCGLPFELEKTRPRSLSGALPCRSSILRCTVAGMGMAQKPVLAGR
jgi:hypothetical protein